MKFKAYLFLLTVVFLAAGCQPGNKLNDKKIDYSRIAGTWKAEKGLWQVTISESGKVVSAIYPKGTALVKPNETTYIKMKDGSKSYFTSGDFPLIYEPDKREIEVIIQIKDFCIRYLENRLEGNSDIAIVGPISEDFKTWNAEVIHQFDYGPRFPQGAVTPVPTVFHKVGP